MISIKALLERNPHPSDDEIRAALSSNLCRCTGYMQIYESVRLAMERMNAQTAFVRAGGAR
jgi:carbon-monoxide dehydrogenase small subunit